MYAIRAFVGPNGGGKTLGAVVSCVVPAWQEGRPVVSNMQLFPEALGFAPELYRPLTSWMELLELENCLLVLDEISRVLPSRSAMSVPVQLVGLLNQLRKTGVECAWTAPNWARCDVLLREVTQAVTVCKGSWPTRYVRNSSVRRRFPLDGAPRRDENGQKIMHRGGWEPNRRFEWTTFDAMMFDEFTYGAVEDVPPIGRRRYWRPAFNHHEAYNTWQAVDLLDHLDDVGLCIHCGGSRSRPKCQCGPVVREPRSVPLLNPVDPAAPIAAMAAAGAH